MNTIIDDHGRVFLIRGHNMGNPVPHLTKEIISVGDFNFIMLNLEPVIFASLSDRLNVLVVITRNFLLRLFPTIDVEPHQEVVDFLEIPYPIQVCTEFSNLVVLTRNGTVFVIEVDKSLHNTMRYGREVESITKLDFLPPIVRLLGCFTSTYLMMLTVEGTLIFNGGSTDWEYFQMTSFETISFQRPIQSGSISAAYETVVSDGINLYVDPSYKHDDTGQLPWGKRPISEAKVSPNNLHFFRCPFDHTCNPRGYYSSFGCLKLLDEDGFFYTAFDAEQKGMVKEESNHDLDQPEHELHLTGPERFDCIFECSELVQYFLFAGGRVYFYGTDTEQNPSRFIARPTLLVEIPDVNRFYITCTPESVVKLNPIKSSRS